MPAADAPYPIFVLTLPGDEARRQPLLDRLAGMGLGHELFFGIDGREGLSPAQDAMIDRPAIRRALRRDLCDAELACALSHQAIYRAILTRGLPGAVILEDDAIVDAPFGRFMQTGPHTQADMILLDHRCGRFTRRPVAMLMPGVAAYRVILPPTLATGYVLSAAGARWMLDACTPLSGTADWPCDISRLGAIAAAPRIVGHYEQGEGWTHLQGSRARHKQDTLPKGRARLLSRGYWALKIKRARSRRLY